MAQSHGPISRTNNNMTVTNDLVTFNGTGKYHGPAFSWYIPVGVTGLAFFNNSTKLGEKYANNIFVGDINNGNLYFFNVNKDRDGLVLDDNGDDDDGDGGRGLKDHTKKKHVIDNSSNNSDFMCLHTMIYLAFMLSISSILFGNYFPYSSKM
jgi:hypothetical protein